MEGRIFLSLKEARRLHVINQTIDGKLTAAQAALVLKLSIRQVKRLKRGVMILGEAFLAHKNRGKTPKHAIGKKVRDLVVSLALDARKFKDASCEHMAELLAEYHGIAISSRSIRRILNEAGIKLKYARKPTRRRRSRDRMPSSGILVQIDASPFAWLEDRGPSASLHGGIDDATGAILALFFRPTEDLLGHLSVLFQMLLRFGIPRAIYSDRHTIFFSPKKDKLTLEEEIAGKRVALTQFGRAIGELGINHIPALSPQAKGRVERLWETLQGRLTIELRLAGVSTIEEANGFLPGFIERFNRRFAVQPSVPESAFSPCPPREILDRIVCVKETRQASQGSTISVRHQIYRLLTSSGATLPLRPRSKVEVLSCLDGSTSALYNGEVYRLQECPAHERNQTGDLLGKRELTSPKIRKPPADHPWRTSIKPRKRTPNLGEPPYEGFWEDVYAAR